MKYALIDTNLIIRYLVNDDPPKAAAVERLLKQTTCKLVLPDMVFAEIIWVLGSYYQLPKEQIVDKLRALLQVPSIAGNKAVLDKAVSLFGVQNVSFIDAYLAALAQTDKIQVIYSYDRDFDKFSGVKRQEP